VLGAKLIALGVIGAALAALAAAISFPIVLTSPEMPVRAARGVTDRRGRTSCP